MKNKNLNEAPTRKELEKSKFTKIGPNDYYIELNSQTTLNVRYIFLQCEVFLESNKKNILPLKATKKIINDVVNLYGNGDKCNFIWNNIPKPKIGEVWTNKMADVQVIKVAKDSITIQNLKTKAKCLKTPLYGLEFDDISKFIQEFTKSAGTLDEYYKQKHQDEHWDKVNKRIDDICNGRKIIAKHVKPESLLNPYSHKALKAAGQIPHDTNEKDYDSQKAFKELLQVRDFVNKQFEPDENDFWYNVIYDTESKQLIIEHHDTDFKCGLNFTSYDAAGVAMQANEELFLKYLQVNKP